MGNGSPRPSARISAVWRVRRRSEQATEANGGRIAASRPASSRRRGGHWPSTPDRAVAPMAAGPWAPSAAHHRGQGDPALVQEDHPGAPAVCPLLTCGHSLVTQWSATAWSRSDAMRRGRCGLQPNRCVRIRRTCAGDGTRRVTRQITSATRSGVHRLLQTHARQRLGAGRVRPGRVAQRTACGAGRPARKCVTPRPRWLARRGSSGARSAWRPQDAARPPPRSGLGRTGRRRPAGGAPGPAAVGEVVVLGMGCGVLCSSREHAPGAVPAHYGTPTFYRKKKMSPAAGRGRLGLRPSAAPARRGQRPRDASVDLEDLPGHEGRLLAGEEFDHRQRDPRSSGQEPCLGTC
jgi:hypothetical protein